MRLALRIAGPAQASQCGKRCPNRRSSPRSRGRRRGRFAASLPTQTSSCAGFSATIMVSQRACTRYVWLRKSLNFAKVDQKMKCDVVVLGAGIVGVCVAVHLQKRGRSVILLDRRGPGSETSFGNAGLIQREAIYPYGFPHDFGALARYAINRTVDAHYHASALPTIAPFLWKYWTNSGAKRHEAIARTYANLIERCVDEHEALIGEADAEPLHSPHRLDQNLSHGEGARQGVCGRGASEAGFRRRLSHARRQGARARRSRTSRRGSPAGCTGRSRSRPAARGGWSAPTLRCSNGSAGASCRAMRAACRRMAPAGR